MNLGLADKVVIVTGAGSGIGAAICRHLAEEGAEIIAADIDAAAARNVAGEITSRGGRAYEYAVDVSDPGAVEALVAFAVKKGGPHLAVNNAGIGGVREETAKYPLDEWHKLIGINLNGVFYCMKYEIAAMLKAGGGAIVNVTSVLSTVGLPGASAYAAAKHGVLGLTKSAAVEYARRGIRINAVGPGWIDTPMLSQHLPDAVSRRILALQPTGRHGKPEEIAVLVCFLLSKQASFMTGSHYLADGAYTAL